MGFSEYRVAPKMGPSGRKAIVSASADAALRKKCRDQETALRQIESIADAAIWMEGEYQIYKTIRRIARAGRAIPWKTTNKRAAN